MNTRPRMCQKISDKLYKCWIAVFFAFVVVTGYGFIVLLVYFNFAGFIQDQSLITIRGTPIGHDFIAFYSTGILARTSDPSTVYSTSVLYSIQNSILSANISGWAYLYPPSFLLICVPLSFLPYVVSFLVWSGGTICGYLLIMRCIAPHPITPWLFLGFPGVVFNLAFGQNGCLSSILLGGGILLLERTPFLAGSLLGLLTYKPHLVMLVPIALLAGRYWRALWGFLTGAAALALVSMLLFGYASWLAFFQNLPYAAIIWQKTGSWAQIPTVYALCRLQGADYQTAMVFQIIMTLTVMSVLVWTWLRRTPLALRGSILALCIPLSIDRIFTYDLALLGIPFAFLGWHLFVGKQWVRQILLMIAWMSLFYTISITGSVSILGTLITIGFMILMVIQEIGRVERGITNFCG